jgi:hypothetical protein
MSEGVLAACGLTKRYHDGARELRAGRRWRALRDFDEILLHAIEAGRGHRVVLDVLVAEPFTGPRPLVALEQLAHDVQRRLLVAMEIGILAGEQRLRVRVCGHRIGQRTHLCGDRQREQESQGAGESRPNGKKHRNPPVFLVDSGQGEARFSAK